MNKKTNKNNKLNKKQNENNIPNINSKNSNINVKNNDINNFKLLLKRHKNIIFTVAILCVIVYVFNILIHLIKNPADTFLVEQGQVSQEENAVGYIIRDETVLKGENYKNGMSQIKIEGERVAKGEAIFRYYSNGENNLISKIKELDQKIDEVMQKEASVSSTGDIKVLENQITEKLDAVYYTNDLSKIKEYKKEINTYITKKAKIAGELSPSGSYLKKLIAERSEYEKTLNTGAEYLNSPISGVVSYRVDGLEQVLTTKSFENISKQFLEGLNLKTGQIIATNDESGKIIDNYKCYIATILNSEYAKKAKVGDKVKLRLPSGNETEAKIEKINIQGDNEYVLILKIEKCVEELISYRKISFEIIWWSYNGKKIPNSAISYEIKGENQVAYVIRTRAGYQDKILVKELKTNGKYTIVADYTSQELEDLGYTVDEIKSRKIISIYDEILNKP